MSVYFNQNSTITKFNTKDSWIILNPIEKSIKEKIERIGTPLKDWDIKINYGIKTGFNEAFIIDGTTKDRLIAEDPKSAEIIRPILRGRDIKRYSYDFADLWIITTFPSLKLNIEDFPAIKHHLLSFGYDRLKQTGDKGARKKTNNKWFELQDTIAYWEDFYRQKIMYSEIVNEPRFYLDQSNNFFAEATSFIMTGSNLEYLVKVFNSRIMALIYKVYYSGGGLGENGYRYKKVFFENLPVPFLQDIEFVKINENNENNVDDYLIKCFDFNKIEVDYLFSYF